MGTDDFSQSSQMNARRSGEYARIAAEADARGCVFCDLKDKYIIYEKKGLVVTTNLFPYIDGQLLVIPRRHIESVNDLTTEEVLTNHAMSLLAVSILREQLGVEGVWLLLRDGGLGEGASGKTVRHLHWNIMPYKKGLNDWHIQEFTMSPLELSTRLRPYFGNERA